MVAEWVKIAGAMFLPNFGAMAGQKLTSKTYRRDVWYKTLKKPWFCPPTWVFGPAWMGLYSSMGYASYLIWKEGGGFKGKAVVPLALYGTQLAMNWAWSHIFFGAKMIGLAEIELISVFGVATATAISFKPVSQTAFRIMLPYLAWLGFACMSIFEVWRLNRDVKRTGIDNSRKEG